MLVITFCSFNFSISQVGIGTAAPTSYLDINGDLALREGTAITVVAGANAITLTGEYSHYRLTGATSTFNINTITGGNDGQVLTLINATGRIMTINNNNAANGILTGNGVNLVSSGTSNSSVSLIYNATLARWTVTGYTGMVNTNGWNINGNTATATDFIGTINAQPFRVYCNNIERIRINATDGEIITGALASPYAGDLLNGVSTATLPFAVNGYSNQNGSGVWGETLAASSSGFSSVQGYYGGTGLGAAVFGNYAGTNTSTTRAGVVGIVTNTSNGGASVFGNHQASSGNQHMGVLGQYNGAAFGMGVIGVGFGGSIPGGSNDYGVVGWRANNQNYSGYFNGNHVIANGTKSASVGTSKGNQLLYVTEAPEVWFEDLGGGQLVNGTSHISLDEMYLETVFIDNSHPMRIFLQEEGESNGLIVIKDADNKGFTVKEKNNGTSNISFSYRIMAKRLHFQDHRFGNDPVWGEGDTRKYNQYATPPPVDYNENVRFQAEQKKNYKPTPMPEGFIDYMTLQKQSQQFETKKTEKKQ